MSGCDTFPGENSVLYLRVQPSDSLLELEKIVRSSLDSRERIRDFVPHVTLYDNAPDQVAQRALELLANYVRAFPVEGFQILRQDTKGTWQRYGEALFEDIRRRSGGGLPVTFVRSGSVGPWLERFSQVTEVSYPAYPWSGRESGLTPQETLSISGYRDDGALCALGMLVISGAQAFLEWLWVAPGERACGLGATLLDELAHYCSQRGLRALYATMVHSHPEEYAKVIHLLGSMGAETLRWDRLGMLQVDAHESPQLVGSVMRLDLSNRT